MSVNNNYQHFYKAFTKVLDEYSDVVLNSIDEENDEDYWEAFANRFPKEICYALTKYLKDYYNIYKNFGEL